MALGPLRGVRRIVGAVQASTAALRARPAVRAAGLWLLNSGCDQLLARPLLPRSPAAEGVMPDALYAVDERSAGARNIMIYTTLAHTRRSRDALKTVSTNTAMLSRCRPTTS